MDYELTKVKIGKEEYPIKCDCYVLAQLQKEYGSISEFEYKLRGLKPLYDEDGRPLRDGEGRIKKEIVEQDIETCMRMLVLCVKEGLEITGEPGIDEQMLIRSVKNPFEIANILAREFYRCFSDEDGEDEKKRQPSRSRKK